MRKFQGTFLRVCSVKVRKILKIAQINTVCGNGSVGRITVDIYHALKQKGHEGKIYYGRRNAPEDVNAEKFGSDLDMGIHVFHTFVTGTHGFSSKAQTKRLIEHLREYDPDLIHLHNIHGFYLDVEAFFAYLRTCGKPIIWTLHDCWSFTGHCAYFDYAACDKWKKGCEHCPQYRNTYPYALFKDASSKNYARKKAAFQGVRGLTIVTPSNWLGELVKESYLKEYPVKVIPNGIDLEKFVPQKHEKREKHLILGVANVWDRRKGLDYLKQLSQLLDPEKYEVAAVGVSKKQLSELPKEMVGIEHTRNVEELMQLYSAASVYVNPTLEDNFPTTNLEALACGTPVVTFETGGSVESVDETCGRIVQKKDVQGLCKAVTELCDNVENMRDACRNRALLYNKYNRFGEYLNLYEESINHYNNL